MPEERLRFCSSVVHHPAKIVELPRLRAALLRRPRSLMKCRLSVTELSFFLLRSS